MPGEGARYRLSCPRRSQQGRRRQTAGPVVSTMPKVFAPRDLLPGVVSPGGPRDRRGTANAAGVDDACRGLRVSSLLYPHELDKTPTDGLPRPVLGPGDVVAVHGVPLRVARRQCPPLTARCRHVQDGVHDVALRPLRRPADTVRSGPEYVGTRSAMRSHSSSVKSPCVDRQVFEMDPSAAFIWRVHANSSPDTLKFDSHSATIIPTASRIVSKRLTSIAT